MGLLFSARKIVLNSVNSRLFPMKSLDKIPACEPITKVAGEQEVTTEPDVATESTKAKKATRAKTRRKIYLLKLCEVFLDKTKN